MKLALIPPVPNLDDFEHDRIHMCLAQLFGIPGYINYYRKRSEVGDYVILDNGAHEGCTAPMVELLPKARCIGASEIVLPDHPMNPNGTIEAVNDTLTWLDLPTGYSMYEKAGLPNIMVVPHARLGREQTQVKKEFIETAKRLIEAALKKNLADRIVIGVPLLYDNPDAGGDYFSLVYEMDNLAIVHNLEVHLLGWPRNLSMPRTIAREPDFLQVRSIDTAKPIVFGRYSKLVRSLITSQTYKPRPKNYFESPLSEEELHYARHNVTSFREALDPTKSWRESNSAT